MTTKYEFVNIYLMKKNVAEFELVRYQTQKDFGLNAVQVAERIEHNLTNEAKVKSTRSYLSIFVKNICTYFNLIWLIIAIALICVGSYSDLLFLLVIFCNTAVAIIQECRAKHTVEKLSLVTLPRVKVVREGNQIELPAEQLLLDDVIMLSNGEQVPSDCIILDGEVEVNESLLTGESNAIKKKSGDSLLSGSFLVSGTCYARVEKVGKDNYIQTIAARAKEFKAPASNLFKDINNLIKYIGILLIPLGVLTFVKEFVFLPNGINEAITNTAGALTGMIPAGMFLLITISLSVGVVKLGRKKTLVKDIYSIEMLARSNVLCLDKTGTITDGTMVVKDVIYTSKRRKSTVDKIISNVLGAQTSSNATSNAMVKKFGVKTQFKVKEKLEFSSSRKFSVTTFENNKTYYLGAPTYVKAKLSPEQTELMKQKLQEGFRVIALTECDKPYDEEKGAQVGTTLALYVLEDHIRDDAIETIRWFKENEVEIKIISGDDPVTVAKIAQRVGVEGYDKYVSLENVSIEEVEKMALEFTVFGRVSPEQKYAIVKTLKKNGKVVAMTGDGVNDTLALKEADCSIAMADGSEVARNISHLVLLNSNFTSLPSVVKEGRQVVNNVQNSSVLYLMKTLFTIVMCLSTIIMVVPYPFAPRQMFLLELLVIGMPSFILTFQPNTELIKGNFIPQVLKKSIPRALLMLLAVFVVIFLGSDHFNTLTETEYNTLITLTITFAGFLNLAWLCQPLTKLRAITLVLSLTLLVAACLIMPEFFTMTDFSFVVLITFFAIMACMMLILLIAALFAGKIKFKWPRKKNKTPE